MIYQDPCQDRFAIGGSGTDGLDVFLSGTVFMDMIFTGLADAPELGAEAFATGLGSAPGGIANMAVAMSRLGLRVGLAADFADDLFGEYLYRTIGEQESVQLDWSRRCAGWTTPTTISLAYNGDRCLITYGDPVDPEPAGGPPIADPPPCRAVFISIDEPVADWVRLARARGAVVFADVGHDPTGRWSPQVLDRLADCDVFVPNRAEACAYTRTDDPWRAAELLAERVGTVAVKCGGAGAIGIDVGRNERSEQGPIPSEVVDTTGAGDVFGAGFVFATLAGWPLADRLRFANLTGGLKVRHHSGSLGAPCWNAINAWYTEEAGRLADEYGFLAPYLARAVHPQHRLAAPTVR